MNRVFQQLDDARREAIARDLASKAARFMWGGQRKKADKCFRAMRDVLKTRGDAA